MNGRPFRAKALGASPDTTMRGVYATVDLADQVARVADALTDRDQTKRVLEMLPAGTRYPGEDGTYWTKLDSGEWECGCGLCADKERPLLLTATEALGHMREPS